MIENIENIERLYHCHKVNRHIRVYEDYEIINGVRTLIACDCPTYTYGNGKLKCNGYTDHGTICGYANLNTNEIQLK